MQERSMKKVVTERFDYVKNIEDIFKLIERSGLAKNIEEVLRK